MSSRTALVTGANRGIGLEVCWQLAQRGLKIILTGRSAPAVQEAAPVLRGAGGEVRGEVLDVACEESVAACAARLSARGDHVDVLVNNAGVYPQGELLTAPSDVIRDAMAINFFGALWTARAWMPGMLERGYGRIVNVTSGYGSFSEGLEGPAAYAITTAPLASTTRRYTPTLPVHSRRSLPPASSLTSR